MSACALHSPVRAANISPPKPGGKAHGEPDAAIEGKPGPAGLCSGRGGRQAFGSGAARALRREAGASTPGPERRNSPAGDPSRRRSGAAMHNEPLEPYGRETALRAARTTSNGMYDGDANPEREPPTRLGNGTRMKGAEK